MNKLLNILLLLLFIPCYLRAKDVSYLQKSQNVASSVGCTPSYTNTSSFPFPQIYLPRTTDNSIPVRINLIFVQTDDGEYNFQKDNLDHQLYLDEAINQLNTIYANLQQDADTPYCYVGNSFISDTKIRFEDHRYYIRDSYGWNNNIHYDELHGFNCSTNIWYLNYLDSQIVACDTIPRGINIYFTEDEYFFNMYLYEDTTNYKGKLGYCSQFPSYSNMNASSRIHMPDYYSLYWCKVFLQHPNATESEHESLRTEFAGWLARSLAHELGHSLDLRHNRSNEDLTNDDYKLCKNSIMQQSGSGKHNFLSPFKIGIAHYALMGSNVQRFIPEDCYAGVKQITQDVSFPKMRFYHSLNLSNQCNVTFGCSAIMSPDTKIRVTNGSTLTIQDARITPIQDSWIGIVVENNSTLVLSNVHVDRYNIIVNNGGKVIIKDSLTIDGDNYIKIKDGGCICIDDEAIINLVDPFSIIEISPNALIGCNQSSNATCLSTLSGLPHYGNGKVVLYISDAFIQNEIIATKYLVTGNNVKAGYNVTTTKPVGPVTITNSGKLRILTPGEVQLGTDFEVQAGGTLEIKEQ